MTACDKADDQSLGKWWNVLLNSDTNREYEDGRLVLSVKKPTVIEMEDAVDGECKISLHEKLRGSDGRAAVLSVGCMKPSVREFDVLGDGAFSGGTYWNIVVVRCACCTASNATSFGVSHDGEEAALRTAVLRMTMSCTERSDVAEIVPKDASCGGWGCEEVRMKDQQQGAKDF